MRAEFALLEEQAVGFGIHSECPREYLGRQTPLTDSGVHQVSTPTRCV